ncbi:PEP-CTERM system TPR-repeat protein PrsT [Aquincola tertiaricarbonis]|uniref:PEP-CTERM system TPR-repeat protein PrsT n=1 Tax=Aquincola tertiaricarbonis TaxID=391953 RepID=A0ABY4SEU7_AQUTE|nr:XrtA/PEP-CTERM system TPR-repeat protein PrsT [Aquincola tertiaricarbonis]URI10437.1 PEP-CTERM system TPR-repeat protein PrsT [Aquincola tertiaricarbonis]
MPGHLSDPEDLNGTVVGSVNSLIVSVGVLAACLSACSPPSPEQHVAAAEKYLSEGQTSSAIIELKNALAAAPQSVQARFLLGKALLDNGAPDSAALELKKAIELPQAPPHVWPTYARALLEAGKSKQLTDELAGKKLSDPAVNADLQTQIAGAWAARGDLDQANQAIAEALRSVPAYSDAMTLRARIVAQQGRPDEAFRILDDVLAKSPASATAWQLRAELLMRVRSDTAGALAAHQKAHQLDPKLLPAAVGPAVILLAQGKLDEAATQIQTLKKQFPASPQGRLLEAQLALQKGDIAKSKELLQPLQKIWPDHPGVLLLAGAQAYQAGSLVQAESLLQRTLINAPTQLIARQLLARTYVRGGQPAKALSTLQPVLAEKGVDAVSLSIAAEAHLQSGDPATAESMYRQAVALDPGNAVTRTALASARIGRGDQDGGVAALKEIAATDSSTVADLALVSTLTRMGRYIDALTAIDALQKKQPDSPSASFLRGGVQLLMGQAQDARSSFGRALEKDPAYFPATAQLAKLDIQDAQPEQAKKRFQDSLKVRPNHLPAQLALLELETRSQASQETLVETATALIRQHPQDLEPRMRLIDLLVSGKALDKALAAAQDAVTAFPSDARAVEALGRLQAATGNANQAEASFSKVSTLDPTSPLGMLRLAELQLANDRRAEAVQSLQRALVIRPDAVAAHQGLIRIYTAEKRVSDAVEQAKALQAARPLEAVGWIVEAELEAARRNDAAAITALRKGLPKQGGNVSAIKLHALLKSKGMNAEAQKVADDWTRDHPSDTGFVFHLGDVALGEHNWKLAIEHYQRVLSLRPQHAGALNNIAWAMVQTKQPGSVAFAEKANQLQPRQPTVLDTLAKALAAENQMPRALEVMKQAVSLRETDSALRLELAKLYVQSGDKAAAKTELQKIAQAPEASAAKSEAQRMLQAL